MWNTNMESRQMEKRVVVGRVRPTWARNLPEARDDDEKSDEVTMMPQSDPPSPSEQWETNGKQEARFDAFGKVMLLGDSGVGKTCMLVRFRDGTFLAGNYISTVGIDFRNKVVTVDSVKVKLQIWDTAGQERFRSVTHAYYRDAHALLLLYDVTNKTSFDNIRAWLGEIREYAQDDVVIMLLGNKSDSGLERAVRREEGQRLAREYQVAFMETSAKTGLNVEAAFAHVARALVAKANPTDTTRLAVRAQQSHEEQRSHCPPCS
ncbi:ras-related protein Rab-37 isoform X1 [Leptidea sinapis]|uniref:ras-related protein Rab-37 isoform X1 n=1 Tax=Leptidea sinapis TaxID=189913 RepID=UPI00213594BD|nr:ras-related protein Rab-37 isoform X1 [Leptidea sinapis]